MPVSATAITGQGHLEFSTNSLDFGQVPIGSSKSLSFTITNTGNIPVTVTKAKAPTGDFNSPVQLSEGLVIGPEQTAVQSVTFTPRSAADLSASYEVTGTGTDTNGNAQGAMYVQVKGTGTGTATTTSTADGQWQTNGSAIQADGGGVQLTPATSNQAGTAVYSKPLRTEGLRATFTAKFGPGSGGKGMTLALLDPAQNSASALGGNGDGLGIAGRPGTVIALATGYNPTLQAQNFVGVGRSSMRLVGDRLPVGDPTQHRPAAGHSSGRHPGGGRPSVRLDRRNAGDGRDTDADVHRAPGLLRCHRRQRRRTDGERPGRQRGGTPGPGTESGDVAPAHRPRHGRPGPTR